MDSVWGLDVRAWTALYTLLTGGLLLVAIIAALYAHRQWRIARDHFEEQRAAQIEAMRPYVTVTVEPGRASMQLIDLIVRNIGQRPAQNVRIVLDPPPVRAKEMTRADIQMRNMKMLNEPMALLAPGQEIRAFYDNHLDRKDREDLPTEHCVKVTYSDTSGRSYEGQFILDLLALKGMSWTDVGTVHTISKSLKAIEKSLTASSLLKRGKLEVSATTEPYKERQMREEIEDLEHSRGYLEMLRSVSPNDANLQAQERRVLEQEGEYQRRVEDGAVEPILRQVHRARNTVAWARRQLRTPTGRRDGDKPALRL